MDEKKLNNEEEELRSDGMAENKGSDEMADAADANATKASATDDAATADATASGNNTDRNPLDVALDEIAALKDKYLRQVAEFDNYRKRTLKELSLIHI